MAWVPAVAWVLSLTRELPNAAGMAKKKIIIKLIDTLSLDLT